jgi:predicted O-methyltransferase YrrM
MNSVSRLRQSLTLRQAATIALVSPLGIAAVWASLTGRADIADALIGALITLTVLGLLQVRRRVAHAQQSTRILVKDVRTVLEQTQRRLVDALERERLAAADREQVLLNALERAHRRSERAAARLQATQTSEIEAMLQLFRGDVLRAPVPSSEGETTRPADLLALRHLVEQKRPRLVLEFGGGASTIWMAYACERVGGRLVSVDHDPASAGRTRSMVAEHGLDRVAEVREAPLRPFTVDGVDKVRYDVAALDDLYGIDLLVLGDTPEGNVEDHLSAMMSRLEPRLSATATVFVLGAGPRHDIRQDMQYVAGFRTGAPDGEAPDGEAPEPLVPNSRVETTLTSA